MKNIIKRRRFLRIAGLGTIAAPMIIPRSVLAQDGKSGANDRIIIGFVGTGNRARQLMEHIPKERGKIVALSELNRGAMMRTIEEKKKSGLLKGEKWNTYDSDIEMFDKENLDCTFVITQDHNRTLPAMRAVIAGLDVYAEKALTVYVAEGRVLADCVKKYKRVFQVGSQQRSMRLNDYGCSLVRDGKLGKVRLVQGINYPGPKMIPNDLPEEKVPDGLNWDAWLGPTPYRKFNGQLMGWMQWWDFSGGEMTNWGAHGVDQIQWALGASETGPVELWPLEEGNGKVAMKYANGVEVRMNLDNGPWGGAVFRCEKGNLEINRNNLKANPKELTENSPEADPPEGPTWIARPHIENFFDCMVSRKRPNADVEIGHRSITVCHLLNITRELNRKLKWDPEKEQFANDPEANHKLDRPRRKGYELPK